MSGMRLRTCNNLKILLKGEGQGRAAKCPQAPVLNSDPSSQSLLEGSFQQDHLLFLPSPWSLTQASTALTGGDVSGGPECGRNAGARGITGSL